MHIFVAGNPAPQGSVNAWAIKRGGAYTGQVGMRSASPVHGEWRNEVTRAAAAELHRADIPVGSYLFGPDQPCSVEIRFYLPRPKSHYGTGRNAGQVKPRYATAWPMVKDWDKLARTICDALQLAKVVADDKQFVGTPGVWRVFADYCAPGADIWVEPAPEGIPALALLPGLRRRLFGASSYSEAPAHDVINFATGNPLADDINRDIREGRI